MLYSPIKFFYILVAMLLLSTAGLKAQNIVVNPSTDLPTEVIACGDSSTFQFRLYGTTGSDEQVSVQLPAQSEFVALVSPVAGVSVDATNSKNPIFTIAAPLIGTISFIDISYTVQTGCSTMVDPEIEHTLISNPSISTTVDYPSVLYSSLEVDNAIIPLSASLRVKETQDFTFTIGNDPVNNNAYSNNVVAYIQHSDNISLTYNGTGIFSLGSVVGGIVTDTLELSAVEISTIGDNDSRFEQSENISVTVTAELLNCPSGAGETITYQAAYGGCITDANACESGNTSTSGIALASGAPDLYTRVVKRAWPGLTTTDTAEFLLRNDGTGAGDIYNLTLDLGFSNGGATYIPVDYNIYTWSNFNVDGTSFANQGTEGSFADFQLTTDPDGAGVGLEDLDGDGFFDDLPVGNSLVLEAELAYNYLLDSNNDTACDRMNAGYSMVRWAYEYKDQCGNSTSLNVPNNGLNTWRPWSFYNTQSIATNINSSSGSANFGPGDTFDFFISTSSSQTPTTTSIPGMHWEVHYTLPPGIIPNGNGLWESEPFDLISFNSGTGVAIYSSISAPTYGYLISRNPKIPLMVDPACSGSFAGGISYEYHLKGDSTYEPVHICEDGPTFTVTCPSSGPAVCVSNFSLDRTTLGYTDMTETTPILANTSGLRLDHVLEGDMVRWHVEIDVNETNLSSAKALLEYDTNNWFGTQSDGGIKTIQIEYLPSGGGTSTISNNLDQYSYVQNNSGKSNHSVDILGGDFSTITPGLGDRYIIDVDLKVSENSSISYTRYMPMTGILASSPVTSAANPTEHTCNFLTEEFGVLAYKDVPTTQVVQQSLTIDGCNEFGMGIRFHHATYSVLGDLFPNEFRNFAIPKVVDILVPVGVDYVPGTSSYRGYGEFLHDIADPVITYNAEPGFHRYSWTNDGSWSKEKASVSYAIKDVNFNVVANCTIEDWSFSDERLGIIVLPSTEFEIFRNVSLPGRSINMGRSTNVRNTQYLPLSYTVSSPTPTISTNTQNAEWVVDINNTTSGGASLQNTWIAIEITNNNIVPTLWDNTTEIPLIGYGTGKYWAQVGDISSSGKQLEIRSNNFTVCGTDSFDIRVGQNCSQYPTDPDTGYPLGSSGSNYNCSEEVIQLSLSTQDPSINVTTALGVPPATYDFCDVVPYSIDVNNAANGFAYALAADIKLPVGMVLDNTSGVLTYDAVDYAIGSGLIVFSAGTNTYSIDISAIVGSPISGANGLPGVSVPDPNEFKVNFELSFTCDYVSGSKIITQINAESGCQQAIDPNDGQSEIKTNPVNVTQVPSNIDYDISVTSDDNAIQACNETEGISVEITNQGIESDGDIEFVVATIDDAFNYVSGSYVAGTNGPSAEPTVSTDPVAGTRILKWQIPDGVGVTSLIAFDFEIEVVSPEDVSCQNYDLNVATRIEQSIDCSGSGGPSCPVVQSVTAQTDETISVEKSTLLISSTSTAAMVSGNDQNVSANFSIENTSSTVMPTGTIVSAYYDSDTNGAFSTGDVLVGTKTMTVQIPATSSVNGTIDFITSPDRVCNILLVIESSNNSCACVTSETEMISPSSLSGLAGSDVTVCEVSDSIQIGQTSNPNYSYSWAGATAAETAFLDNIGAAQPTFTYSGADITIITNLIYTVTVTLPNGCTMSDDVQVKVYPSPNPTVNLTSSTCNLDNGEINFTFPDNLNRSSIEFSLDNQASYQSSVPDNSGSVTYSNLASGSYRLWARWGNNQCPIDLGEHVISDIPESTIDTQPIYQSVFVNDNAIFTVNSTNADMFQWQESTDGGVTFNNISNGPDYSGAQTATLNVIAVDLTQNNFQYRVLVSSTLTTCADQISNAALLTIKVKSVITNRRITVRVKKN